MIGLTRIGVRERHRAKPEEDLEAGRKAWLRPVSAVR